MAPLKALFLSALALAPTTLATSLVDYSAARKDNPSIIGQRDLEAARGDFVSSNTSDLYVELGTDSKGTPALHYHRKKGDIRAEYHALPGKTQKDTTYYIGYKFSLAEIEQSLMIWQFKEYEANNDGGANIPLAMEIVDGKLQFQYQASGKSSREAQWTTDISPNTVFSAGIVINTAQPEGWVQLYWNGELQKFSSNGKTNLTATTFPGRADPKFGAYRGEAVAIDTYVYEIQIGTALEDIKSAAGIQ
ncbi:hypothetical protein VTN77DRAFT_5583 [Rasamsonia byssochlamydoides]|uniref:uncharacterized protein n=1 Tax=Rasamsonia byssochlamydoides TaxID=89139 RepID=UPI003741EA00